MTLDLPGFAAPMAQAQTCFRALLDAMARPGTLHPAVTGLTPPAPLCPATAAVLLTLVDGDTPLWLDPAASAAWDWVGFHCGARAATVPAARFACALAMPDLAALDTGSDLAPEESATLILQVDALGEGPSFVLRGPGIEHETTIRVSGLPMDFGTQWAANHALYPRGVDLVLSAGDQLCALPRSVQLREG